jgi:hypothetical protein
MSVCLLAVISACGDDDDSAQTRSVERAQQTCLSPELSADRTPRFKERAVGQPFSVDLTDLTSTPTQVSLTVSRAQILREVPDKFAHRGTYGPAPGYRFVSVTFTFGNAGKDEIEAANSVGNIFVLATRGGRAWQRVDRTDGCTTVSSSLAAAEKVTDPEAEVKPGGRYTTVIVYAVPESARRLVWYGAGDAVAIEPKGTG